MPRVQGTGRWKPVRREPQAATWCIKFRMEAKERTLPGMHTIKKGEIWMENRSSISSQGIEMESHHGVWYTSTCKWFCCCDGEDNHLFSQALYWHLLWLASACGTKKIVRIGWSKTTSEALDEHLEGLGCSIGAPKWSECRILSSGSLTSGHYLLCRLLKYDKTEAKSIDSLLGTREDS